MSSISVLTTLEPAVLTASVLTTLEPAVLTASESSVHVDIVTPAVAFIQQDNMCAICRENRRTPEVTLNCGHKFCLLCIGGWLGRSQSCPTCREPIEHNLLDDTIRRNNIIDRQINFEDDDSEYNMPARYVQHNRILLSEQRRNRNLSRDQHNDYIQRQLRVVTDYNVEHATFELLSKSAIYNPVDS